MYECVKRAREWHGAGVVVVPLTSPGAQVPGNDILDDLGAETLLYEDVDDNMAEFVDPKLLWRGRLCLPGVEETIPGFEMVADEMDTLRVALKNGRCGGISRTGSGYSNGAGPGGHLSTMRFSGLLKPLSWVIRDKVPRSAMTDKKFSLRFSLCHGDGELGETFMNHERFREMCAVVKLEYCEPDCVAAADNSASSSLFSPTVSVDDGVSSGVTMGRTGEDWRRCVLDGTWARSADDILAGTEMEAAHFVIFKDTEATVI